MADIHKFTKDGKTIWPATSATAVVDPGTRVIISDTLETWNIPVLWPSDNVTTIEKAIPVLVSKIPASKQIPGCKVEFVNNAGENETWEFVGGTLRSFEDVSAWSSVGGKTIRSLVMDVLPVTTVLTADKYVIPVGQASSITYDWMTTQAGKDITADCSYSLNYSVVKGNSFTEHITPTKYEVINRRMDVTYRERTSSAEIQITAVQPSYYGPISGEADINPTNVVALDTQFLNPTKELVVEPLNLNNQRFVYAFPVQLGALGSVKDVNGFEYLWENGGFRLTTLMLNEVRYNVYYLETPVVVKDFKFIFS